MQLRLLKSLPSFSLPYRRLHVAASPTLQLATIKAIIMDIPIPSRSFRNRFRPSRFVSHSSIFVSVFSFQHHLLLFAFGTYNIPIPCERLPLLSVRSVFSRGSSLVRRAVCSASHPCLCWQTTQAGLQLHVSLASTHLAFSGHQPCLTNTNKQSRRRGACCRC